MVCVQRGKRPLFYVRLEEHVLKVLWFPLMTCIVYYKVACTKPHSPYPTCSRPARLAVAAGAPVGMDAGEWRKGGG